MNRVTTDAATPAAGPHGNWLARRVRCCVDRSSHHHDVTLSTSIDHGVCTLAVRGQVDVATADAVAAVGWRELVLDRCTTMAIDLDGVTFMDASGLRALVDLRARADRAGKQIHLYRLPDRIRHLLAMTGLSELFTVRHAAPS